MVPLLYLYTLALTSPKKVKKVKRLLHFVLPVSILFLFIAFWVLSNEQKIEVFKNEGEGFESFLFISEVLLNISGVFYIIVTSLLLRRHKKRIAYEFSNQENINLNWLRFLFYAMGANWVLIILVKNDTWIFTYTSVLVLISGYFGIKQVGIFTNTDGDRIELDFNKKPFLEDIINHSSPTKIKYAKSGLSYDASRDLLQRLITLMKTDKVFIEPELTLTDLAGRLDIHPNYLSQVINVKEGVNFYDYINSLRIEEFKRLVTIPENQKFTIMALA